MIPLGLFRSASFSAAVAAVFLIGAAIYAAAFLTSQFFQLAAGDSPLTDRAAVPALDRGPAADRPAGGRALGPDRRARR